MNSLCLASCSPPFQSCVHPCTQDASLATVRWRLRRRMSNEFRWHATMAQETPGQPSHGINLTSQCIRLVSVAASCARSPSPGPCRHRHRRRRHLRQHFSPPLTDRPVTVVQPPLLTGSHKANPAAWIMPHRQQMLRLSRCGLTRSGRHCRST